MEKFLYGWCFDSSPATLGWLLASPLLSLDSLDQTAHFLLAALHSDRPWPKQVRVDRGKRALTTTTPRSEARTSGIELLTTPYHAPRANAICERFLRSVRQECLDHVLILHEKQLQRVLNAYVAYFNQARPHQGIQQQIPASSGSSRSTPHQGSRVVAVPILAGLHHDYRKVA